MVDWSVNRATKALKIMTDRVINTVLAEHGIQGEFTVTATDLGIGGVSITEVNFVDPRVQFIYELKGGNKYFLRKFQAYYVANETIEMAKADLATIPADDEAPTACT